MNNLKYTGPSFEELPEKYRHRVKSAVEYATGLGLERGEKRALRQL